MNSCDFTSKLNIDMEDFDDENQSSHKEFPKENQNESLNKDPKFDMISPIRNKNKFEKEELEEEEEENENENGQQANTEKNITNKNKFFHAEKPKMSKEEIVTLVCNKKSELNIKIFDLVTKNQVEEKKVEEMYEAEQDEEKKANLLGELEDLIKSNENNLNEIKE